jgi:hypothetical protein
MRSAAIPAAQVDVVAVASKKVGVPTEPGVGESTVIVGEAEATSFRVKRTRGRVRPSPTGKYGIVALPPELLAKDGKSVSGLSAHLRPEPPIKLYVTAYLRHVSAMEAKHGATILGCSDFRCLLQDRNRSMDRKIKT